MTRDMEGMHARFLAHPKVITIHEEIRESDSSLYLVFEYMKEGNSYELVKSRKGNPFSWWSI